MTETPEQPIPADAARLIADAVTFAAGMHRGQRRGANDAEPYFNHLAEVADYCAQVRPFDAVLVAACYLHDTLEETEAGEPELRARFGDDVTELVLDVTDPPELKGKKRRQRQVDHTARGGPRVKLLKIADKTSNVLELVNLPAGDHDPKKSARYLKWARRVVDAARGTDAHMERRFDAAAMALDAVIARIRIRSER